MYKRQVLGGDHSIAAGSISATSKHYKNIGIIWVDAHGDWNNEESSPSGNMHGMPFSAVCGAGPDIMVDFGQDPVYVNTKNCVQIAGRDIDEMERIRMREHGITVFSIADIDRMGMPEVIDKAIEIASAGTEGIHVSFDVDSCLLYTSRLKTRSKYSRQSRKSCHNSHQRICKRYH